MRTRARTADGDDMIVVTDVFSNGAASLADVVQPPRDNACWTTLNPPCARMLRLFPPRSTAALTPCASSSQFRKFDVDDRNF